ncbi:MULTISPECIES: 50S ribosomal protein L17 [Borrelia]|uniref:Large ribosomal subunit protein bL17 n=3 Tax=Borrelia TaxID=138 RepID=RL17_BORT9|nr:MULTISPECIES: 50S ribosomal protein L17 [Borrelia]A1QZT9.1 RecName: Full=Large ribosomal subunit protein bL17; AltName: Full=50S ribosomal protein L17 [Borrelia turicatae 91E135]AAX17831.1 LSU ribosomal protein L17P [Borrelia turicatae 91E135]AHE62824.1 50S ribosomal protein L17 [Borrelia parkeri HR1]AHH09427.1 LSU ribosomal protein L17P [Borrelia parkeri SLO]ANF33970.1 50S ribosomal protein L17 [Borrelia turicatae]UPA10657.1 50S ribosomal protein L17 [Borrelia parkeri]
MKTKVGFNRLDRKSSHRKALLRNMVISLFRHEKITSTKAKLSEVKRFAEKLITRAKVDSVHNRREVSKFIHDKYILNKLFTRISPIFKERKGGYTRVIKLGQRYGDAAEMAILELVDKTLEEKQ